MNEKVPRNVIESISRRVEERGGKVVDSRRRHRFLRIRLDMRLRRTEQHRRRGFLQLYVCRNKSCDTEIRSILKGDPHPGDLPPHVLLYCLLRGIQPFRLHILRYGFAMLLLFLLDVIQYIADIGVAKFKDGSIVST